MQVAIVPWPMEPVSAEIESSRNASEKLAGGLALRTTAIVVGLTLLVLGLVAGRAWRTFDVNSEEYERRDRLRHRAVALLGDRQALTVLARAAVDSGHAVTAKRYRAAAASFEVALTDLRTLAIIGVR